MPISISVLALGFLLGLRHATDSDHVVTITTISTKEKSIKGSALIGILWGIGHSITVTLIGIPIIFFSLKIPPKILLTLEFSVGVMLVILGIVNLYGIRSQIVKTISNIIHKHNHSHLSQEHSHLHIHLPNKSNNKTHHLELFPVIGPIFVGLMHGLAGSSAIVILILSTINNRILAAFYLVIFHVGVIMGMIIITTLLGASIKVANQKIAFINKYLVAGSGILSIAFGLYISYQIGFVDGLFTNPKWNFL